MGSETSPVTGKDFPALSPAYKKEKKKEGYTPEPNLEKTGKMLDALDFKVTEDGIEFGVFGKTAPQADGHNNLSGDSQLPERRFIPDEDQTFTEDIMDGVQAIINDAVGSQIKKADLEEVQSTSDLYAVLGNFFEGMSRSEIKVAVLRLPDLYEQLDEMHLLDFL